MGMRIAPPSVGSWGRLLVIGLVAVSLQWAWHEQPAAPDLSGHGLHLPKLARAAEPAPALSAVEVPHAVTAAAAAAVTTLPRAQFYRAKPSRDARQMADWIVTTRDNQGLPFFLVDKKFARLYVFDPGGRLRGSSTILLGLARGDDSVPGVGERTLKQIKPWERTTPAGRFVGELGRNAHNKDVVWVDYDNGVSMHRVITNNPKEHRLARLASTKLADKRISYGCINVPARFFDSSVKPALFARNAVIYVLPEKKSLRQVFPMDNSDARTTKFRRPPTTVS
jgi:hypothetical protein